MRSWIAIVLRLVADDLGRMAVPVGLWLNLLAVTAWVVWPETGVRAPTDVESLRWMRPLLYLAGPLVAGLFVLLHPVDRRAFWRTRPWTRGQVMTAKAIEVVLVAWLPAALLQVAVLARLDLVELPWHALAVDLALTPGAWILGGAALGTLVRSVEDWLVAAAATAVALFWVWGGFRLYWLLPQVWEPWRLAGLAATAVVVFTVAHLTLDRRAGATLAVVLLLAVSISRDPAPPASTSTLIPLRVASIGPPTGSGLGAPPGCESLCVDLIVDNVPNLEPLHFEVEGIARGDDGSWRSRPSTWSAGQQVIGRQLAPRRWALDASAFAELCADRFDRFRGSAAEATLDVKAIGLDRHHLAAGPLRAGEILDTASPRLHSDEFQIRSVVHQGRNVDVTVESLALDRASVEDRPFIDPYLLIGGERSRPIDHDTKLGKHYRLGSLPIDVLPFVAHRLSRSTYTWTFNVGHYSWAFEADDPLDDARLLLEEVAWGEVASGSAILDNVTLGELACDRKRRTTSEETSR